MAANERDGYEGLSKIAHAIRRIGAAYIASMVSPPGTTIPEMLETADVIAKWAGGEAQAAEDAAPRSRPIGEAWPPRE